MTKRACVAIVLGLSLIGRQVRGQTTAPSLFDPNRHMRVSEVKPGMKGYGLSVFHDTTIDRFDVEVISVLHNFNPKYDVVLVRCRGANLEHSGAVAGMSGSPVYLTDEHGRDRLIGAFAYGWPLLKDPIAGVQPIEYMLEVGSTLKPESATTRQAAENGLSASGQYRYDPLRPTLRLPENRRPISVTNLAGGGGILQLQPLATPLMAAGISPRLLEQFTPLLGRFGFVPLQAGGIGGSSPTTTREAAIVPGAVLAAPLLTGDVELTAIGTCTEVIGDRVFGFGHPFSNEGPITLPMGSGRINGVISSIAQSFKIGAMTELRGTLIADQVVGVAGRLGNSPPTIPIDVRVVYTDGSLDVGYHFDSVSHPRLTPVLSGLAVTAAMAGQRDLPQYHTVEYDLMLRFAGDQKVRMKNVVVNSAGQALFLQVGSAIVYASENPFESVMLKQISGTIHVTPQARQADILSVSLPKMKYRPGETLKAFVRYRPFRAEEAILPIELQLPHTLRNGTYQLTICDQQTYIQQEQAMRPFRFVAENAQDIIAVLRDVGTIRQDALYVQLLREADGVAVGRTAMPLLPSSRRQVLLEAGRSNVTPFVSSTVLVVPTELVMIGSAEFQIEIDTNQRVEGAARHARPEPHAPGSDAGKTKPVAPPRQDAPTEPKDD